MEKRSFKYTSEKSNKFWAITLYGCSHTVDYGRLGSLGKNETKAIPTEEQAKQS